MKKTAISGIMLTLLLIGMLTLAFNIKPVKADWTWTETIYIRADGSVDPGTAPISSVDNITYTFADDIVGDVPAGVSAVIVERDNIVVHGAGYTVHAAGMHLHSEGISLSGRSNVTLKNMQIKAFYYGVHISTSSSNTIVENSITDNYYGIRLYASSNNTIVGNSITNYGVGIHLESSSSSNIIAENNIVNNQWGVRLYSSSSNTIAGNNITDNREGIFSAFSSNTIVENSITANSYSGIHLKSSSRNTIIGNNVTDNYYGIYLESSSSNTIAGNSITDNYYGIHLFSSSSNTIIGNNVTDNYYGIYLFSSSSNIVAGNSITANNRYGIILSYSSNYNTISGNDITSNWSVGTRLYRSSNNQFYHNNFVDNGEQVRSEDSINVWDDGYPSGGNYWSDYEERYPAAEELDGSGIWDTPYEIDADNQDNYPLMEPYSPLPRTIDELKAEIEELGLEGEVDNQGVVTSLLAKLNAAQKLIDDGNIDQAKNILNAFINEVQAQSGKHITPEAAELLIESAEYIHSNL